MEVTSTVLAGEGLHDQLAQKSGPIAYITVIMSQALGQLHSEVSTHGNL